MGIAYRLLSSVLAFVVQVFFPIVSIEPRIDLESTAAFMVERNRWIESAKEKSMDNSSLSFNDNDIGGTNSNTDNTPIVA